MVSRWIVLANEVALHVCIQRDVKFLKVLYVDGIHVEISLVSFLQVVNNLLIISLSCRNKLSRGSGTEQHDHKGFMKLVNCTVAC